eukprot:432216-Rhodomonas_salina.1
MDEKDFVGAVDDNFLCNICRNVMIGPCACNEGHQFCFDCISKWIEKSATCPQRCGGLGVEGLTKLRGVENMINKLLVKCVHSGASCSSGSSLDDDDSGCAWVGSVEERAKHLATDCSFSVLECSFAGCGAKVA